MKLEDADVEGVARVDAASGWQSDPSCVPSSPCAQTSQACGKQLATVSVVVLSHGYVADVAALCTHRYESEHEECRQFEIFGACRRAQLLAGGDAAALLLFAAIGRINHGEILDLELLMTALPFWAGACSHLADAIHPRPGPPAIKSTPLTPSYRCPWPALWPAPCRGLQAVSCFISHAHAGWFSTGSLLGAYGKDAQDGYVAPAAIAAAKTWAVATPVSLALRGLLKGYMPPTPFIVVSFVVTGTLLIGWRSALAALTTPEVRRTVAGLPCCVTCAVACQAFQQMCNLCRPHLTHPHQCNVSPVMQDKLTALQRFRKNKSKKGNAAEFMSLLGSLTKRW